MTRRLFLLAAAVAAALVAEEFTGEVVAITDGDTIRVMRDGRAERIRLWGIDCQESKQAFGTRAKQFTGDLAVTVRVRDVDRYKRLVAEIILPDGRNLNREVVRAGFAWWYRRYARGDRELERLEAEARATRRGLRADKAPVPARLKEWAYAGFAINLASALIAHVSVGDGPEAWGWVAATGMLWGLSYFFWRRLQATPASA